MEADLTKICRTCLAKDASFKSIYDAENFLANITIANFLKTITKHAPSKSDGLPELVCETCLSEINRCNLFHIKCINSDNTLRNLLGRNVSHVETENRLQIQSVMNGSQIANESWIVYNQEPTPPVAANDEFAVKAEPNESLSYFVISSIGEERRAETAANNRAVVVDDEVEVDVTVENERNVSSEIPDTTAAEVRWTRSKRNSTNVELQMPSENKEKTSEKYQCPQCDKICLYPSQLKKHLISHITERAFICSICNKGFKVDSFLKRHIAVDHKKKKCKHCPRIFLQVKNLKRHQRTHNKRKIFVEPDFPDDLAPKVEKPTQPNGPNNSDDTEVTEVPVKNQLNQVNDSPKTPTPRKSTRAAEEKENLQCETCKKVFLYPSRLAEHMRIHSTERPFSCTKCPKSFKQNCHLNSHMLSHSEARPFACKHCARTFSRSSNLKSHLRTHFRSDVREKMRIRRAEEKNAQNHQEEPDEVIEHEVEDTTDLSKFHDLLDVPADIKIEENPQNNSSDNLCPNSTIENSNLDGEAGDFLLNEDLSPEVKIEIDHDVELNNTIDDFQTIKKNNSSTVDPMNKEKYKCPECSKVFRFPSRLKEHMRAHSNLRPFVCNICGKGFKQSGHLKSHTLYSHKRLTCKYCPRTFSKSSSVKAHQRTHGKRKYNRTVIDKEWENEGFETINDDEEIEVIDIDDDKSSYSEIVPKESQNQDVTVEVKKELIEPNASENSFLHQISNFSKFQCPFCPNLFTCLTHLKRHVAEHNIEKRVETSEAPDKTKMFKCEECLQTFAFKSSLTRHLLNIHKRDERQSTIKTTKCEMCMKAFATSWALKEHMKCHSTKNDFPCPFCGKAFKKKYNLKVHIESHTQIRPHKCNICGRSFGRKKGLARHMPMHQAPN